MNKRYVNSMLLFLGLTLSFGAEAKGAAKKEVEEQPAKLDISAVKQVVKSKMLDVQQCYTDLIIEGMAKAGKVSVTWDIDDKGAVQNLTVKENTSEDQALAGCVTEKVQNWTFPSAKEGSTFATSYTFKFGG